MNQTPFGRTPLHTTQLGLGLAALGRPGYINLGHADDLNHNYDVDTMRQHAHTMLDAAYDAGIRYFDTARSYGRAEAFLASWLVARQLPVSAVTIGSKWGYTYTADWQIDAEHHEIKEHSIEVLKRQTAETWDTLGDYLDIYHIHSATLSTGVLENDAVLNKLADLKAKGWVVGLSLSGDKQGETLYKALEVERDGQLLFGSVQATWNLLERSAEPALKAAHEAGLGVIIKEAVANGRLTPRNPIPVLAETAAELNTTADALAIAAVLAQPWVDVVLSGAAQLDHLHTNLKATEISWNDTLEEKLRSLIEPPEQYWQTRSNLAWN